MTSNYHTPHAFGAPLTSAEINARLSELDTNLGYLLGPTVWAVAYGVVADGSTDNSAAIAAAIADLPSTGGTVILPGGLNTIDFGTTIDISSKSSIIIRGQGGVKTGNSNAATVLRYTGTGDTAINMQHALGCWLQDLSVIYNSASFTGCVVDMRNVGGTDPAYCGIQRCTVGSAGGTAVNATVGIDLDNATRAAVRDTLVLHCEVGIRGKSVNGNYSNQVLIENCSFRENTVANIKNPGEAWMILACESNPLSDGKGVFIAYDSGVRAKALSVMGCWMGDVTDTTNAHTQISVLSDGVVIQGNAIGIGAVTTGISYGVPTTQIAQSGNKFTGSGPKVANPQRTLWLPAHAAGLDGSSLVTLGTAPDILNAVALADSATQGAFWTFWVPTDWDGGSFFLTPVWSPGSTDGSSHAVRWSMDVAQLRGDGGQSPGAGGTTTAFTGASAAYTAARIIHDTTTDSTVSPIPGQFGQNGTYPLVRVNLRRLGSDGADTYVGTVNLIGVVISY